MSVNSKKEWYYANNGQKFGAFTLEEMIGLIQTGTVSSKSFVWHKKLVNWKEIKETEFQQFFDSSSPPPLPTANLPQTIDVPPPLHPHVSESRQKEWYYSNSGERLGPLTYKEVVNLIQNKNILAESFIWHKKLGSWKKAKETEFQQFFNHNSLSQLNSKSLPSSSRSNIPAYAGALVVGTAATALTQGQSLLNPSVNSPSRPIKNSPVKNKAKSRTVVGKRPLNLGAWGNVIWFVFGGFLSGLLWLVSGLLSCITIIGIPVGLQCFKFMSVSFFPFGKEVVYGGGAIHVIVNIIWFILLGLWMAIVNAIIGCLYCMTIIGIPFGLQFFKIAKLSLMPFGAKIVVNEQLHKKGI